MRQVLADCLYIRTAELGMLFEQRRGLRVDLRVPLGKSHAQRLPHFGDLEVAARRIHHRVT
jgi:hypothetical protein